MKFSNLASVLAAVVSAMGWATAANAETTLRLSTGVDYSSGKYGGTQKTDVIVAPFSAKVSHRAWSVRATLPVISIKGPSSFVVIEDAGGSTSGSTPGGSGSSGEVTAGLSTARKTTTGLADLSLSGSYTFDDLIGAGSYLELGGRVRLPTGDEAKGLSLGVTDYGTTAELGVAQKRSGAYVLAGRRFNNDAKGLDRVDGWQTEVGGWVRASEATVVGGSVDWRESSVRGGKDVSEASAYVSYKLTDAVRVGATASAGLTDGAADYGVGLNLSWKSDLFR